MKKIKAAAEELADRLSEDMVFSAAKLTVIAGKKILIENHKGIIEYGTEHIVVSTERGKIALNGSNFTLDAMNNNELLICGRLQCVDWE